MKRLFKVVDTSTRGQLVPDSYTDQKTTARKMRDTLNREHHGQIKADDNLLDNWRTRDTQQFQLRYLTMRGPDHDKGETFWTS